MEAEFVAASQTAAEMMGIIELLKEIGVSVQPDSTLHVDNQAAIAQIKGEDTSGRAKHIDVRLKFVKDLETKEDAKGAVLRIQGYARGHTDQDPPSAAT
uniref:Polyprotein n=1 Tax=Peronospora matthiolae TaxID=2874970 RepID=A0AAV1SZB4_9STRA